MSTNRDKFVELAEKRVNRAINDLRLIGNLSNKTNYKYDNEDVKKIFSSLEAEVKVARKRFESIGSSQNPPFRL